MEFRQLRHFIAVAQCGTFSKASAQLHLTQPALTRSIQTLEDTLAAPLFERQPRGVALTPAGQILLRHALLLDNQLSAAREDVHALQSGVAGKLEIGLAPVFSATIIDQVLIEMNREFPDLQLGVTTALTNRLLDRLMDGSLDVVLSNIPAGPLPPDLEPHVLFDTRSFVVAGRDHPLASAEALTLQDLQSAQWALVTLATGGRDALSALAQSQAFDLTTPALETNSLTLLRTMLLSSQFLSVLPEHWLKDELSAGEIVRLPVKSMPIIRPAGVMTRKEPSRAASVALFVEKAQNAARDWVQ